MLRADVGTNLAARCRGFEQRAEGGFESLHEVAGQLVERRIARVKGCSESSLGRDKLGVALEPLRECYSWLVPFAERRGGVGAAACSAANSARQVGSWTGCRTSAKDLT